MFSAKTDSRVFFRLCLCCQLRSSLCSCSFLMSHSLFLEHFFDIKHVSLYMHESNLYIYKLLQYSKAYIGTPFPHSIHNTTSSHVNPLSFDGYRVSTQWQKCKSKRASAAQFSEQCQFIRARHQVYQSNWRRISLESTAKPVQKELTSLNQLSFMINDRFLSSFFPLARKSFRQLPIFYVRSLCFQNKFPSNLFLVLRPFKRPRYRWR